MIYKNFDYIPKILLKDNYITKISIKKKKIPKGVEVLEACRQAHHYEDLTCTFQHLQIKDLNQPKKKEEEVICSYS